MRFEACTAPGPTAEMLRRLHNGNGRSLTEHSLERVSNRFDSVRLRLLFRRRRSFASVGGLDLKAVCYPRNRSVGILLQPRIGLSEKALLHWRIGGVRCTLWTHHRQAVVKQRQPLAAWSSTVRSPEKTSARSSSTGVPGTSRTVRSTLSRSVHTWPM
jgi:hypothetical protein